MTDKDNRLVSGDDRAEKPVAAKVSRQVLVLNIGLESAKFLENPLIEPLSVQMIGYFIYAESREISRLRGSDHYVVMFCSDGKGWFQQQGHKKVIVRKNTAIIVCPGVPYAYGADSHDPWSFYFVHIRGKLTKDYFENVQTKGITALKLEEGSHKCKQLFAECCDVVKMGVSQANLIYSANLLGQLLTLLFIYQGRLPHYSAVDSPVRKVIQHMLQHIEDKITLQQLCEMTHLSKPYLVKLFRKNTGYSPIDYFLRLKIQQAGDCLETTGLSVKEVCFKFGFSDPYYFSRMFSKIMGQSPMKYRRQLKP
ncbi:MAG: transcriptional regulator, AraC family [Paenibacillus sp.]|jgi:AraC-like DNA-binding protein|nr:transcriptional regulator, AraC family [Paenibacillus sp.]